MVTMLITESATEFLQVLNDIHPSLAFTMELEQEGSIPFLSTVIRRSSNSLTTKVYRKPVDTGLWLHFQSHADKRYKLKELLGTFLD